MNQNNKFNIINDLYPAEKNYIIQKSTPLSNLWKSNLTLEEFKILDIYLARINSHKPENRVVKFEKGLMEKILGVDRVRTEVLKRRLKNLMYQVIEIENIDNNDFSLITLFSMASCRKNPEDLWTVELSCTEEAMKYFFNVEKLGYLRYKLRNVVNLTSKYSYTLFIYLEQNRFRNSWDINIEELKNILGCSNKETYSLYKNFNRCILKKASKEIIDKTELVFSYDPVKVGKNVDSIRFSITSSIEFNELNNSNFSNSVNLDDLDNEENLENKDNKSNKKIAKTNTADVDNFDVLDNLESQKTAKTAVANVDNFDVLADLESQKTTKTAVAHVDNFDVLDNLESQKTTKTAVADVNNNIDNDVDILNILGRNSINNSATTPTNSENSTPKIANNLDNNINNLNNNTVDSVNNFNDFNGFSNNNSIETATVKPHFVESNGLNNGLHNDINTGMNSGLNSGLNNNINTGFGNEFNSEFNNDLNNETMSFLASACNNEFSVYQIREIYSIIVHKDLPEDQYGINFSRYHYLNQKYSKLNVADEFNRLKGGSIGNRYAYFLKLITEG